MHALHRISTSPLLGLATATLLTVHAVAQSTRYQQPIPVAVAQVATEPAGSVIGLTINNGLPFTTQRWDGSTWTPLTNTGPVSRILAAMTGAPGGVVLFGGVDNTVPNAPTNDTWRWNGSSRSQLAPTSSPSARYGAAAAQMPGSGHAVIFGGASGTGVNNGETWTFDGLTWHQVAASGPSPRFGAAMAQDGAAGLLLFGGVDASGFLDDTWRFDGAAWTQLSPATTPPARMLAAMVADPQPTLPNAQPRTQVLLSGGVNNALADDLWVFQFGDWSLLSQGTIGSPVRSAAFDANHREAVFVEDPMSQGASAFVVGQHGHTQYGVSCACAGGAPILSGGVVGPQIGQTTSFDIQGGTPNGGMFLVLAFSPASVPITPACNVWVSPGGSTLFVGLTATGAASVPLAIPNSVGFVGLTMFGQSLDLVGMCVTNGVETRIGR